MDEIAKASKRTGVAVETLSGLSFVAEQAGSNFKDISTGLTKFSKIIKDASDGTVTATDAFDDLNIEINDSEGNLKDLETLFFETSDAIKNTEDQILKLALAQEVFGKGGANMVVLLDQGSEALRRQIGEAKELGIVFDEEAAGKAEAAADAINQLQAAFDGFIRDSIVPSLPALTKTLNLFTSIFTLGDKISKSKFGFLFVPRGFNEFVEQAKKAELAAKNLPAALKEAQEQMANVPEVDLPLLDDAILGDLNTVLDTFTLGLEMLPPRVKKLNSELIQGRLEFVDTQKLIDEGFEHQNVLIDQQNQKLAQAANATRFFVGSLFDGIRAGQKIENIISDIVIQMLRAATINLFASAITGGFGGGVLGFLGFSHGGRVPNVNPLGLRGPDTVPALLSPGEMVLTQQQAQTFNINRVMTVNNRGFDAGLVEKETRLSDDMLLKRLESLSRKRKLKGLKVRTTGV